MSLRCSASSGQVAVRSCCRTRLDTWQPCGGRSEAGGRGWKQGAEAGVCGGEVSVKCSEPREPQNRDDKLKNTSREGSRAKGERSGREWGTGLRVRKGEGERWVVSACYSASLPFWHRRTRKMK
eukprot:861759-Prorocentrum_minimum.AAC.2